MKAVTFSFRAGVSADRQAEILLELGATADVSVAAKLKPASRNATVARMAYLQVADDGDVDGVMRRLAAVPEIDSPALSPRRGRAEGEP